MIIAFADSNSKTSQYQNGCFAAMAYALGFSTEITALIYSMRDFRLEEVKRRGGTPSRIVISPYKIWNLKVDKPLPGTCHAEFESGSGYWIVVKTLYSHPRIWISGLHENRWWKNGEWDWSGNIRKGNDQIDRVHGPHIYPCAPHELSLSMNPRPLYEPHWVV